MNTSEWSHVITQKGSVWRWRVMRYEAQIGTGTAKKRREAEDAARKWKKAYIANLAA